MILKTVQEELLLSGKNMYVCIYIHTYIAYGKNASKLIEYNDAHFWILYCPFRAELAEVKPLTLVTLVLSFHF
jgi:hypothetical protein